jgi:hypothetical protein
VGAATTFQRRTAIGVSIAPLILATMTDLLRFIDAFSKYGATVFRWLDNRAQYLR